MWIIIANATECKIFQVLKDEEKGDDILALKKKFSHPERRLKNKDLVTNRPNHFNTSHTARSSFSDPQTPKQHELESFAIFIVRHLEEKRTHNQMDKFILI